MKRTLTLLSLLFLLVSSTETWSQVKTQVNYNDKLLKKAKKRRQQGKEVLVTASDSVDVLNESIRQNQINEAIEAAKRKAEQVKEDSLSSIKRQIEEREKQLEQLEREYKAYKKRVTDPDTIKVYQDSITRTKKEIRSIKKLFRDLDLDAYKDSLIAIYLPDTSGLEKPTLDSTEIEERREELVNSYASQAEELLKSKFESHLPPANENGLSDQMAKAKEQLVSVQDTKKRYLQRISIPNKDSLIAHHAEKIERARQDLAVLQHKDVKWGKFDARDKSSFKERITWGGNIQLNIDDPTIIDLSPWIGWKLNKKWIVGAGVNYRSGWTIRQGINQHRDQTTCGFRTFTEYDIFKGFYGHIEYERQHQLSSELEGQKVSNIYPAWLMGIGKSYNLKNTLSGNFQILYQLKYSSSSLYDSPWVVRFGIKIN